MKKSVFILSIAMGIMFVISFCIDVHFNQRLNTIEQQNRRDDLTLLKLDNFEDITMALLKIEKMVFKNDYHLSTLSDDNTGYTHLALIDLINTQFESRLSYSCETHSYFMTPVCEQAVLASFKYNPLFNENYYLNKENYLFKNNYINQMISEHWYSLLFDQDTELNKKFSFHEKECTENNLQEKTKIQNRACAEYVFSKSANSKWPVERLLKESKYTPITDYLMKNKNLYSKVRKVYLK